MFKPNNSLIGTTQIVNRDISAMKGTIIKGSKVKVIACEDKGYSIQDIDSGEVLIECGFILFETKGE